MRRDLIAEQSEALARRQTVIESLDKELYNVTAAAMILKKSKQKVYDMITAGDLDAVVSESGVKRIPKAELARALAPAPFDFIRQLLRELPDEH